jgi:hypothetical protein
MVMFTSYYNIPDWLPGLNAKISAGAEVVIVQPPLLQDRFQEWWDVAYNRG